MADPSPEAVAAALHAYWQSPPSVSEEDAMAGALRAAAATLERQYGIAKEGENEPWLLCLSREHAVTGADDGEQVMSRGLTAWEPLPDDENRSTP